MTQATIPSSSLLWGLYEHRAKKRFGQHFLVDPSLLGRIAALVELGPGTPVLEIGPGYGGLSATLMAQGVQLRAVELDRDAAEFLRSNLAPFGLELLEGDATRLEVDQMLAGASAGWRVVANLPYNVATVILFRLLEQQQGQIEEMALMFQREVAQRLVARVGEEGYGALAINVQLWADSELVMRLPPGAFWPPPKVHSAVVRLRPLAGSRIPDPQLRSSFKALVKAGFQTRRKTLVNALKPLGLDKDWIRAQLEELGLDVRVRAEVLSYEHFEALARARQQLDP